MQWHPYGPPILPEHRLPEKGNPRREAVTRLASNPFQCLVNTRYRANVQGESGACDPAVLCFIVALAEVDDFRRVRAIREQAQAVVPKIGGRALLRMLVLHTKGN